MTKRSIGKTIKISRIEKDISQRDLAKAIGISSPYLSQIEKDRVPPPSDKVLKKIADVLNIDIGILHQAIITQTGDSTSTLDDKANKLLDKFALDVDDEFEYSNDDLSLMGITLHLVNCGGEIEEIYLYRHGSDGCWSTSNLSLFSVQGQRRMAIQKAAGYILDKLYRSNGSSNSSGNCGDEKTVKKDEYHKKKETDQGEIKQTARNTKETSNFKGGSKDHENTK